MPAEQRARVASERQENAPQCANRASLLEHPGSRLRALTWEYDCRSCKFHFDTPVPRGPKEEREMKCTRCGSRDIVRVNVGKVQETFCGG